MDELFELALIERYDAVFRSRWADLPGTARQVLLQVKNGVLPEFKSLAAIQRRMLTNSGLCNSSGVWLRDRPLLRWIERRQDDLAQGSTATGEA